MTTYLPSPNRRKRPAMPARESMVHSIGVPLTYPTPGGVDVEIRQGCVLDSLTRDTLADSTGAADWVLAHCLLTTEQYEWVDTVARYLWPTCGNEGMSVFGRPAR